MEPEAQEIRRKFLALVWPVIIQNFLFMLMFHIDTAMVGRLPEHLMPEVSLAAMGIIGPVRWAINLFMMGVCIGTVATVAQSVGEKNFKKAETYAAASYLVASVLGVAGTIVINLLAFRITGLFIDDPYVVYEGGNYLRITFLFFCFQYATLIGASILRAAGDTRTPMIITGISNILNIFGNYTLIFGKFGFPALGLYGAAISTGICKMFEGIVMTFFIFSKKSILPLHLKSFDRVTKDIIRKLLKVSIPASIEPFFVNSGFLMFTKIVASLGTFAIAANRVALAVEALSFMPGHAFAAACATIVGHKMGERSSRGVHLAVKQSLKVAMLTMGGIACLFLIIPHYLANIFTDDKDIIYTAAFCLIIGALEQPFIGICQILKGTFHGLGDTKSPIYIGAAGTWIPRVILSYLLGHYYGLGLAGVWIATTCDWILRSSLYYLVYRRKKKKKFGISTNGGSGGVVI